MRVKKKAIVTVFSTIGISIIVIAWGVQDLRKNDDLGSLNTIFEFASYFPNDDLVLYYKSSYSMLGIFEMEEPPDPYHRPIIPFYQNERISETWISTDMLHRIEYLNDPEHTVGNEILVSLDQFVEFDAVSNLTYLSDSPPPLDGPFLFYSDSTPELMLVHMDDLDFSWGSLITEEARLSYQLTMNMPTSYEEAYERMKNVDDKDLDLEQITEIAGHPVYILNPENSTNLELKGIYPSIQEQCLEDGLGYSVSFCHDGLTLSAYSLKSNKNSGAIVLIGLADVIVPRLKSALPLWNSSRKEKVVFLDNEIEAWILSYESDQNMTSVCFETAGLFIQVDGYGLPLNDLLALVSELRPL